MTDDLDDDYELSEPTGNLLAMWHEGSNAMKRSADGSGGDRQLDAIVDYIGTLASGKAGMVIIDLMTLLDAMEFAVAEMQLAGIAAASGD